MPACSADKGYASSYYPPNCARSSDVNKEKAEFDFKLSIRNGLCLLISSSSDSVRRRLSARILRPPLSSIPSLTPRCFSVSMKLLMSCTENSPFHLLHVLSLLFISMFEQYRPTFN